MTRKGLVRMLAGAIFLIGIIRWQFARLFTEQPRYIIDSSRGGVEIRRYSGRVVAETTVDEPDWDRALNEGFRRLAGYIFGGNVPQQKIAMTTPVAARSQRIAMTSPVQARANAAGWTIAFTMPKERPLESLPQPSDRRVTLREEPPLRVAVMRFRGRYTAERVGAARTELLRRVRAQGIATRGEPEFAGYDPPLTLPWLRRNEVWIELTE